MPSKSRAAVGKQIVLLRAVNVGGRGKVSMAALRELCGALGFTEVQSLLQSGNLTFSAAGKTPAALEKELEAAAAKQLGLTTDFFVRTAAEWDALLAANPFPAEAKSDPSHLLVMPLKSAPGPQQLSALQAAIPGREQVRAEGRALYLYYPDGIGRSKLTLALVERRLQTRGTGRNWNTALKLAL